MGWIYVPAPYVLLRDLLVNCIVLACAFMDNSGFPILDCYPNTYVLPIVGYIGLIIEQQQIWMVSLQLLQMIENDVVHNGFRDFSFTANLGEPNYETIMEHPHKEEQAEQRQLLLERQAEQAALEQQKQTQECQYQQTKAEGTRRKNYVKGNMTRGNDKGQKNSEKEGEI